MVHPIAPTVHIRPAGNDDAGIVEAFLDLLDASSASHGFDARSLLPPRALAWLPDAGNGGAILGVMEAGTARTKVVGMATWRPMGGSRASASLVLADGWRSGDLGERLLEALAESAWRAGVRSFVVDVVPHNAALRSAARRLSLTEERHAGRAGVCVEIVLQDPGASLSA